MRVIKCECGNSIFDFAGEKISDLNGFEHTVFCRCKNCMSENGMTRITSKSKIIGYDSDITKLRYPFVAYQKGDEIEFKNNHENKLVITNSREPEK